MLLTCNQRPRSSMVYNRKRFTLLSGPPLLPFPPFDYVHFVLPLLFLFLTSSTFSSVGSTVVHIVPRFTSLPPSVSYVVPNTTEVSFSLPCRAWPPNSELYMVATQLPASGNPFTSNGDTGDFSNLLAIPQGLGAQRYGILSATSLSPLIDSSSTVKSMGSDLITSPLPKQTLEPLIHYESLAEAVRARPAAAPNDQVAVRLSISVPNELRQLERMRLHCLVQTRFGRLLSRPFRVKPTSLGEFPDHLSSYQLSPTGFNIRNEHFLHNNVAVVTCKLPTAGTSHPAPIVQFEMNGTVFDTSANNKYRLVKSTNGEMITLLIAQFHPKDSSVYRCSFINPITHEKRYSPEAVHLFVTTPVRPVEPSIRVQLANFDSATDDDSVSVPTRKIYAEEGQNITLFCNFQGFPIPHVTVSVFSGDMNNPRYRQDAKFGCLDIINVQPSDEGTFMCTNNYYRSNASTAVLVVRRRLRLSSQPQDVRIPKLGQVSVNFNCTTSDPHVTPYWLFNGQPPNSAVPLLGFIPSSKLTASNTAHVKIYLSHSTLSISNVTEHHLGIYQCIAQRPSSSPSQPDEWVTASAILALESDRIVRTTTELAQLLPARSNLINDVTEAEPTTSGLKPTGWTYFDNMIIYLHWAPFAIKPTVISPKSIVEYRVEYSVQISSLDEQQQRLDHIQLNHSRNATVTGQGLLQPALVGLLGYKAIRWSDPVALEQMTPFNETYVTGSILQPSRRYRFRVIPVDPSSGSNLASPSSWSDVISMEHISAVKPPRITMVRPMSKGQIQVKWSFGTDDHDNLRSTDNKDVNAPDNSVRPTLVTQASSQPVSSSSPPLWISTVASQKQLHFIPDYWLLLARSVDRSKSDSGLIHLNYSRYREMRIAGASVREGRMTGLNSTASYQVLVYGVRGEGKDRQITLFSKPFYVNLAATEYTGRYSILQSLRNNRLLFSILGGIAALMFLVVFIFILLCVSRQHRDQRLMAYHRKQNGVMNTGKNPYISEALSDGSAGTRPCNGPTGNENGGTMMMMSPLSNLQCSGFSDHSASNNPNQALLLQQQQAELKNQFYQQQQQGDFYAANPSALSKEMMQQQQQPLLGSQLQLQQQQQVTSYMTHPSQQQQSIPPYHHQSHHSLLFPTSPNQGSHVPVHGGHMSSTTAMFQSGTLPGGPRYLKQQQQQAYLPSHQYGSQQVLNRTRTPANMTELQEYYQQQQQHPHSQLPPVPRQSSSDMPPPSYQSVNAAHRQMGYYPPGMMTPSGMSSNRREPPMGGSMQEGSAYGTLLQRGQLTGSMHGGDASPAVIPPSYYHGSQQALHMMSPIYPNGAGMMTPQPGHLMSGYPQQQQQQQAFLAQQQQHYPAGYFNQQFQQQHPDMLGQGPLPSGFGHADAESIYSYFSQHELGPPNAHQPLNPLPEENQANAGYVDSGIQTAELNGATGGAGEVETSPTGAGNHRHHRRRRRKQQQQQQQQRSANADAGVAINGHASNDTDDPNDNSANNSNQQRHQHHQSTDLERDEQQRLLYEQQQQQQQHDFPGHKRGMYADNNDNHNFVSPQPTYNHHHHQQQQNGESNTDLRHAGYDMRFDGHNQRGQMMDGPLPPPNQPPPPPPPPAVALGSPPPHIGMQNMLGGGSVNGMLDSAGHHGGTMMMMNIMSQQQQQPHQHQQMQSDPLSYRTYSPANMSTSGPNGGGGGYSSGTGIGLLVGPPPRMRDYSEYGIPRGIGLPPTPGSASQQQQHSVGHHLTNGNSNMLYAGPGVDTAASPHYREGQA